MASGAVCTVVAKNYLVQRAFPDLRARDRVAVGRWFVTTGSVEHDIPPGLVEPVARSIAVPLPA